MLELWIEGSIDEAAEVANSGLAAAIATNPKIIANWTQGTRSLVDVVTEMCAKSAAPLYVQLHGPDLDSYKREMETLLNISEQIHPKLVATKQGIGAVRAMKALGRKPLITTIATLNQAYLAAAVGADYIAPYVGRIEVAGRNTTQLISDIAAMYANNQAITKIAAASISTPAQAESALRAGSHLLVMGYGVLQRLLEDELTQRWIDAFEDNWATFSFDAENETIH